MGNYNNASLAFGRTSAGIGWCFFGGCVTRSNFVNHFFANIGKETNESVGQSTESYDTYLKKQIKRNEQTIVVADVTEEEVIEAGKSLNPKMITFNEKWSENFPLRQTTCFWAYINKSDY